MSFIRKVRTASGATSVQVVTTSKRKVVRLVHIGSAHTEVELQALLSLAERHLVDPGQQSLFAETDESENLTFKIGLRESFSGALLQVLAKQFERLGLNVLSDEEFMWLCTARIVEPTSKLDSLRVLADLGIRNLSKNRLYRCLNRIVTQDYRTKIENVCFEHAAARGITLVLYDVTTLYFEIQKEDVYRKPGMSKERRLEPQIVVGLLADSHGFPLGLSSFEGNKAETTTILPVVEAFKERHGLTDVTVVADAGMLSQKNLDVLAAAGYYYIVGSRLNKIPYSISEYQKTGSLSDGQVVTERLEGSRVIYQYREKRATLDRHNIEKQIAKAENVANGTTAAKKVKFLSVTTKEKKLNQTLVNKAYALVGIKGYVTNLDAPDLEIIDWYHQLWNVEASFRMAKSDLRARPIFHHKRDSIEAHLTIVFASLAVARIIESRTGISIKQFVKTLKPIRSGTVVINDKEYAAEAEIPPRVKELLGKLTR